MIRLPYFLAVTLLAITTHIAYAQVDELPTDTLLKLNEKAQSLFPDDARKQDQFIRDNENAYRVIAYMPVEKGEEAQFTKIKARAEEKFPLDFVKQSEFIQNMTVGLSIINAFNSVFADKEDFKKMKAAVLAKNPDDYMAAAKLFETQSAALLEISYITRPEVIAEEFWDAFKLGLSVKFKNDYSKQKDALMAFAERMLALQVLEDAQRTEASIKDKGGNKWEQREELKKNLSSSVLMVQNDQALGFYTTINDKEVIVFPSEAFDARGISITNKLDERVLFGDIYACKDIPISIAFVKSVPEGVKRMSIADEAFIRARVSKDVIVYSFEMRNDILMNNQISAMGAKYLNLTSRLARTTIPGSAVIDTEGSAIMGMVVNQQSLADIGNLSNAEDAKHLVKQLKKEIISKVVVRLDKMTNWEKIDPQVYQQQSELLNTLQSRNEQYLTLFTASRFSSLSDVEVFRTIYERLSVESKTKFEKSAQERMVRDMLSEIISNMKREVSKINPSQMYTSLQEAFEFNLKIRQNMIDTLENAIKNKTYMNYYFEDMKPRGR